MFKINQRTLSNAAAGVKIGFRTAVGHAVQFASSLPKHYHTAKKMLGYVHDAYTTAKKACSVLEPVVGNPSINKYVMKATTGYEAITNKVMDGHETMLHNMEQVKSVMKKAGVRLVF